VDLEPGKIFAQRYRVERLLARGGMGSVYVAQQIATEALVALKVLDPRMLESESQCRAFKVEATVAARVRSHHIVRTLDAGFDDPTGYPYLVMELLEGEPLDELIEREGPLPAPTVVSYVSQIAAGLDRAHGYSVDGKPKPIVHRDLKPSNLMLTRRDDGQPEIKILDFGIAKVLGQTTGVSREIKGTPSYMAFEQAAGEDVTPQTDVWALGLIAFYLLTGKSYWRSASSPEGTLESLLGEVLALPLLPATERMRALGLEPAWPTQAFDAWFARCVHREPKGRFESAGLAAQALRNALLEGRTPTPVWEPSLGTAHTMLSEPPALPEAVRTPASSTPGVAPSVPAGVAARQRWPWLVGLGVVLVLVAGVLLLGRSTGGAPMVTDAASGGSKPASVAAAASEPPAAPAAPTAPTAPTSAAAAAPPAAVIAAPVPEPSPSAPPAPAPAKPRAAGAGSRRGAVLTPAARRGADPVVAKPDAPRTPAGEPAPSSPVPERAPDDLYNRR
jgi:serine/threonine-protein kinase